MKSEEDRYVESAVKFLDKVATILSFDLLGEITLATRQQWYLTLSDFSLRRNDKKDKKY